jgi:hypothetical protein
VKKEVIMASLYSDHDLTVEPTLDEMLADPIVQLIMKRDGVKAGDMRGEITRLQQEYSGLLLAI